MIEISPRREAWLRALEALTIELRYLPCVAELARATGQDRQIVKRMALRVAEDGLVIRGPRSAMRPRSLRVSPAARIALGMPLAVYLACSSPDGALPVARELLRRYGLFCFTPALVDGAAAHAGMMDASASAAAALHAVVVWRDPLLVGRRDVDAARRASVPVTVVAGELPATAAELWIAPRLVPPISS